MENSSMMRKFKTIVSCLVVAFVLALVMATVSFVQIGKARRVNAEYEKQIEQLKAEQSNLKDELDYIKSEEGQDEMAREEGNLPEGEYEIEVE